MHRGKQLIVVAALLITGFLIKAASVLAASQVEVLHAFAGGNHGAISWAGLIPDAVGS